MGMTESDRILQSHVDRWSETDSDEDADYSEYSDKVIVSLTKRVWELEEELTRKNKER